MKSSAKDYPTSLSAPIDRTAAAVASKGVHFDSNKRFNQECWDVPPPLVFPIPQAVKELLGSKQNQMTIVGYLGKHPKTGYKLLARCVCGRYERRRLESWRKMKAFDDCCQNCRHFDHITRQQYLTNEEQDKLTEQRRKASSK